MNKEGEKQTSYLDSLRSRPLLESVSSSSSVESVNNTKNERYNAYFVHQTHNTSERHLISLSNAPKQTTNEVRKVLSAQSTFSPFIRLTSMNLKDIPAEVGSYSKLQTIFLDNNQYDI